MFGQWKCRHKWLVWEGLKNRTDGKPSDKSKEPVASETTPPAKAVDDLLHKTKVADEGITSPAHEKHLGKIILEKEISKTRNNKNADYYMLFGGRGMELIIKPKLMLT